MMPKRVRDIEIVGDAAHIRLSNGHVAIVDAQDAQVVTGRNWYAAPDKRSDGSIRNIYARSARRSGYPLLILHRFLLDAPSESEVDHIDGDGLNNRRRNLRLVTKAQNAKNRKVSSNSKSGVKGVYLCKRSNKWRATIHVDGANRNLGSFNNIADAAEAYAKASTMFHGEFGRV